ncbi:MAG: polyprenyl synthetase family protein [Candidatus Aenigmarchaeota archaeon]|nr:polyprenyl synthetase family protein [Candidatus Aenigmarchaeota archaeon]
MTDNDATDFVREKSGIIEDAMKKFIPKKMDKKYIDWLMGPHRYKYNIESLNKTLSEPIWDYLDRGGKRLRPALFLLLTEVLGGDVEMVKDFAAVVELLHNGSIMVDDIEDNSDLRRGKPCTHKIFGIDIAINAGNYMYFAAYGALMKNSDKFPPEIMLRAYNAIAREMIIIHTGQGMDIAWHNNLADADNISVDEYLQMCANKTGVLLRVAARLAAIFSGKDAKIEEALAEFTETIGIAFQIQDDIMNLQPTEKWGKEIGDDINEGKRTLIVLHALKNANQKDRKRLLEILNMHTKEQKTIIEAIEIMKKYDSLNYAKEFARKIIKDSWSGIDPLLPESESKDKLKKLAEYLVERDI